MYWPSQPKAPKKREENSEDIGKREPRFYVQKSPTTSSTRSQPKGPARVPLPRQGIPVVNKALAKSHARKSSARGASLPNAAPEPPPAKDEFLLQMDCQPNKCVHEKGKPCPNEVCLLAPNQEKKTTSMSEIFTLTRPSSLISKLKDAVKASTSSPESKNKSATKGKSKPQSSDKAAPPPSGQSADKSSKRPSDGAAAKIHEKISASSSTRASRNASGAGTPNKTPPKPPDSAKSKKSTGTGARRCSEPAAKAAAAPPPKKGAAPVVHKAAKKTAIAAAKIPASRAMNVAAPKKNTTSAPPVRLRAKIAQQRTAAQNDGGKRRTSDPKGSGKVVDKTGAKQTDDRAQRDDKTSTDKTSDRGSEKSSSGGKIPNVGDGCVQNAAPTTKSGSMASGTSTSSSRGITKIIEWLHITIFARNLLVSAVILAVVVILLSLIFPEAFRKIVDFILRTDASAILPRRPRGHLLDAPYLPVTLKTGERTVAPEPRDRISGGGQETVD
ncbi:hypothetical protein MTO96_007983 [Rhipicephalus appendiculatus]